MTILIVGNGYIASKMTRVIVRKGFSNLHIPKRIYQDKELLDHINTIKPALIINCAGKTGYPNIDQCETWREETMEANVMLPALINRVCENTRIPWIHFSSGCIYNGDRRFREDESPNFLENTYAISKFAGERVITSNCYIVRIRMPFDEFPGHKNILTKLSKYKEIIDTHNSLSHIGDAVSQALELYIRDAPFGIYNLVCEGSIWHSEILDMMGELSCDKTFVSEEAKEIPFALFRAVACRLGEPDATAAIAPLHVDAEGVLVDQLHASVATFTR